MKKRVPLIWLVTVKSFSLPFQFILNRLLCLAVAVLYVSHTLSLSYRKLHAHKLSLISQVMSKSRCILTLTFSPPFLLWCCNEFSFKLYITTSSLAKEMLSWACQFSCCCGWIWAVSSFGYNWIDGFGHRLAASWGPRVTLKGCSQPRNQSSSVLALPWPKAPLILIHFGRKWQCQWLIAVVTQILLVPYEERAMPHGHWASSLNTIPAPSPHHLSTLWTCQAAWEVRQEHSVLLKCCWCRWPRLLSSPLLSLTIASFLCHLR